MEKQVLKWKMFMCKVCFTNSCVKLVCHSCVKCIQSKNIKEATLKNQVIINNKN
jgi:hypothetical protein